MTPRRASLCSALTFSMVMVCTSACATRSETPDASSPVSLTQPVRASSLTSEPGAAEPALFPDGEQPSTTEQAAASSSIDLAATTPPASPTPVSISFSASQQAEFAATLRATAMTMPNPGALAIATVRHTDGRIWTAVLDNAGDPAPISPAGQFAAAGAQSPPVRMASVGKTFTAATVFRLIESGKFAIDDVIAPLLTPPTLALLQADGYNPGTISVRHLLQHTSGIFDYAFGEGSPMLERALTDPKHVWTRREQLELAISIGDPLGEPGDAFHYSDTNYILLGEIIERTTGEPYPSAMRDLLGYDDLGLTTTWMESGEQQPSHAVPIARTFFAETELTGLDFSIDAFGGGGLAATTDDITRFFEALLAGRVFDDPATLTSMTEIAATNLNLSEFGIRLGDGANGMYRLGLDGLGDCWAHRGFTGIIAATCPNAGVTVALTTNTALTDPLAAATELLATASSH